MTAAPKVAVTSSQGIREPLPRYRRGRAKVSATPCRGSSHTAQGIARFKDIARTSRSIGGDHPDFPAGDFRFPGDYTENTPDTHADALLTLLEDKPGDTPEALAETAALRGRFTEYEMDPSFVGALRADRDALDAANAGKHTDNQEGLEATAAIATLLNQANKAVTRLHGPIHKKYAADPDKIHAWKQASRIESDPAPPEPEPPTP